MIGKYADELETGQTFVSHRRTITETDVVMFTSLTWITDPIFTDEIFASRTQFGRRGVPGPLLLSYALGLTEELIYGTTLAALGINNVEFRQPIHSGATIHVLTSIASRRESASRPGTVIIVFRHEVHTEAGEGAACSFERTMLVGTRAHLEKLAAAPVERP